MTAAEMSVNPKRKGGAVRIEELWTQKKNVIKTGVAKKRDS